MSRRVASYSRSGTVTCQARFPSDPLAERRPGEPGNASDGIYDARLEMELTQQLDGSFLGRYDFAVVTSGACTFPAVTADPASQTVNSGANVVRAIAATLTVNGCCTGDLNGDGVVDLSYPSALLAHSGTSGATPADGDLDGDGDVDLSDLSSLLSNFGLICG